MISLDRGPRFRLGDIVITDAARTDIPARDIEAAIHRHSRGDWGELDPENRRRNEIALRDGSRLHSAYKASNGIRFWIITEADRSVTTVLLPEDD